MEGYLGRMFADFYGVNSPKIADWTLATRKVWTMLPNPLSLVRTSWLQHSTEKALRPVSYLVLFEPLKLGRCL